MARRLGFASMVIGAVVWVAGCGATPTISPPPQATPTRAVPSTSLPSQSVEPSSGLRVVTLPPGYSFHGLRSDGPLAVLDEVSSADDGRQSDVVLVDLAHGTWKTLATAAAGYHTWNPVISGDNVAWEEWRYSGGSIVGECNWRIVAMSMSTGQSRLIASGVDKRQYAGNANCPDFDLDGPQLAYAVEDTGPSRPWGWLVKIVDLATDKVVRSIPTAEDMNYLAFSNGSVAYSEGLVDKAGGFVYNTRLMLSTPKQPTPKQIAPNAYEVSFRDGRLAWAGDPGSSQSHTGLSLSMRVWTASGPSWTPVPVTPEPPPSGVNQVWPAVRRDAVCHARMAYTGAGSWDLWLWTQQTGTSTLVPGSDGGAVCGLGGGWITWAGAIGGGPETVSGMPMP